MFKSSNFTPAEQISLSSELAVIGVEATPFVSLLMSKGNIEKALSTVYTYRELTLNSPEDLSAQEGSEEITYFSTARAELSNILEIFKNGVQISATALAMNSTQLSSEVADRLIELKINMEKKFINGVKKDGSVTPFKRQMSGLIEQADPTNAVAVTGVLKEADIKKAMRNLWNQNLAEGEVYALIGADLKDQVDEIYKDKYGYSHVTTDFGLVLSSINTNFGKCNFILSRHVPADKVVVFNSNYTSLVHLREPAFEELAKNSDSSRGQIVAESTLKVGSKKAVGVITVTAGV